jgi:hypothetical protein
MIPESGDRLEWRENPVASSREDGVLDQDIHFVGDKSPIFFSEDWGFFLDQMCCFH